MAMLDEGSYYAKLVKALPGENEKGTPFIAVDFDVTHEAMNGEWKPLTGPVGRRLYIYLTDAAWPTSKKKLESLEFNGRFDEGCDCAKREFAVECKHGSYEGKSHEKWELADWGGGEAKAITQQNALKWRTLWSSATTPPKAPPAGKPTAPKPKPTKPSAPAEPANPPAEPAQDGSEEVPF